MDMNIKVDLKLLKHFVYSRFFIDISMWKDCLDNMKTFTNFYKTMVKHFAPLLDRFLLTWNDLAVWNLKHPFLCLKTLH